MFYSNLIYFLVVIFVFATSDTPKEPLLAPYYGLPLFAAVLFFFYRIAGRWYTKAIQGASSAYFSAERRLSVLAVFLFAASVYIFDLKYYLTLLSFGNSLPILKNLAGLAVFFFFLSLMWLQARPAYEALFHRRYTAVGFLFTNIKVNLPIILPWLVLSLVFDLIGILPSPRLQELLNSSWGELIFFLVFIVFLFLFFPPLVRTLWNCRPMESGALRDEIEQFFHSQNFSSEILYWPLFEGHVLTAGIMGFIPKFRYLLVTPALISVLDKEELESVLAHEIGHVKKYHLIFYVLLFLGFSLLAGALIEPLPFLLLGSDWFYRLLGRFQISPDDLLVLLTTVSLLILMVLYFRFLFGYFIRNFERQADLFVFKAQGTSRPLIRSFEKIASMSGNIREKKSWHHFGIGQRIDFLEKCERDQGHIKRHNRKIYVSLAVYFLLVGYLSWSLHSVDPNSLVKENELRYAQAVLEQKLKEEPSNSLWLQLLGDLMQENKMEKKAVDAYEKALKLSPMKPDLANNMAWLLLTARDKSLRDPVRALTLARLASTLDERGHILDTLATALWANGQVDEAIRTEIRAIRMDPDHEEFYKGQIEKFTAEAWEDS